VVQHFLEAHSDFRIHPPEPIAGWLRPADDGFVRILPGLLESEGGLDGFFTARLVRHG
jgi:16S rRNA (cytosine967-C5)-methyltransferase